MTPRSSPLSSTTTGLAAAATAVAALASMTGACEAPPEGTAVIERGIEAHGGQRFQDVRVFFGFRGEDWLMVRRSGLFRYERAYDEGGSRVVEVMSNDSTGRSVDGEPRDLSVEGVEDVELAVNSVAYFGFLPFRLDDPAVRPRLLGRDTIRGEPYHAVEVTFREEGGGPDWDDRFIHWFHVAEGTLDYLAYRYHRGDGGTRFREAVNRRDRGGLLVQDYVNRHVEGIPDIAAYPDSLEAGALDRISEVELEEVEVIHPADREP